MITINVISFATNIFKMKCPLFWLFFCFVLYQRKMERRSSWRWVKNWCCLGHRVFHGPEKFTMRWQNALSDHCHLHWNVMCSWGMLGRHLRSYFKRRLKLRGQESYRRTCQSLACEYGISLGVTEWQNQKGFLPRSKAACLASLEENSTQTKTWNLNETFQQKSQEIILFVCFIFLQCELPGLSTSWCH